MFITVVVVFFFSQGEMLNFHIKMEKETNIGLYLCTIWAPAIIM